MCEIRDGSIAADMEQELQLVAVRIQECRKELESLEDEEKRMQDIRDEFRLMKCTMNNHSGIERVAETDGEHHSRVVCSICGLWIVWIFTKAEARRFDNRVTDTYKEIFFPDSS